MFRKIIFTRAIQEFRKKVGDFIFYFFGLKALANRIFLDFFFKTLL